MRAALRAYLYGGETASRSLDLLDRLVVDLLPGQVATAVVAVVDPRTGTVELSSAGHPAPLVFAGDDVRETDVPIRPLLGVGHGQGRSTSIGLSAGATLVLFTDGLVERRGDGVTSAAERLRRVGFRSVEGELAGWVDRLVEGVPDAGHDDTTVLALRLPARRN